MSLNNFELLFSLCFWWPGDLEMHFGLCSLLSSSLNQGVYFSWSFFHFHLQTKNTLMRRFSKALATLHSISLEPLVVHPENMVKKYVMSHIGKPFQHFYLKLFNSLAGRNFVMSQIILFNFGCLRGPVQSINHVNNYNPGFSINFHILVHFVWSELHNSSLSSNSKPTSTHIIQI